MLIEQRINLYVTVSVCLYKMVSGFFSYYHTDRQIEINLFYNTKTKDIGTNKKNSFIGTELGSCSQFLKK